MTKRIIAMVLLLATIFSLCMTSVFAAADTGESDSSSTVVTVDADEDDTEEESSETQAEAVKQGIIDSLLAGIGVKRGDDDDSAADETGGATSESAMDSTDVEAEDGDNEDDVDDAGEGTEEEDGEADDADLTEEALAVQELIDALPDPDDVNEENREDVESLLETIAAELEMIDEKAAEYIDLSRYEEVLDALEQLDGDEEDELSPEAVAFINRYLTDESVNYPFTEEEVELYEEYQDELEADADMDRSLVDSAWLNHVLYSPYGYSEQIVKGESAWNKLSDEDHEAINRAIKDAHDAYYNADEAELYTYDEMLETAKTIVAYDDSEKAVDPSTPQLLANGVQQTSTLTFQGKSTKYSYPSGYGYTSYMYSGQHTSSDGSTYTWKATCLQPTLGSPSSGSYPIYTLSYDGDTVFEATLLMNPYINGEYPGNLNITNAQFQASQWFYLIYCAGGFHDYLGSGSGYFSMYHELASYAYALYCQWSDPWIYCNFSSTSNAGKAIVAEYEYIASLVASGALSSLFKSGTVWIMTVSGYQNLGFVAWNTDSAYLYTYKYSSPATKDYIYNNDNYSFIGTKFYVYGDAALTDYVGTLTISTEGESETYGKWGLSNYLEVETYHTYYIVEQSAGDGFILDQTPVAVTTGGDGSYSCPDGYGIYNSSDGDRFRITLSKTNSNNNTDNLSGVVFRVSWYGGNYSSKSAAESAYNKNEAEKHVYYFETKKLANGTYVAGPTITDSYLSTWNGNTSDTLLEAYDTYGNLYYYLPYGTLVIEEVYAPSGITNPIFYDSTGRSYKDGYMVVRLTEEGIKNYNATVDIEDSIDVVNQTTGLQIHKVCSNSDTVENNPYYDMTGIQFRVYTSYNSNTDTFSGLVGTLTVEEDGYTDVLDGLNPNTTYYIEEVEETVPSTFSNDYISRPAATVTTGNADEIASGTIVVTINNTPLFRTYHIDILKEMTNSSNLSEIAPSLAGAVFKVTFYGDKYSSQSEAEKGYKSNGVVKRTWYYQTVDTGDGYHAGPDVTNSYLPSVTIDGITYTSDDQWQNSSSGYFYIPYGTLVIEEIKAPDGYENDPTWYCTESSGTTTYLQPDNVLVINVDKDVDDDGSSRIIDISGHYIANTISAYDPVDYYCLRIQKVSTRDGDTADLMEGAVYGIYSSAAYAEMGRTTIGSNGCLDIMTIGSDGYGVSSAFPDAYNGQYYISLNEGETVYIKELEAPDGYMLDDTVHEFTMSSNRATYRVYTGEDAPLDLIYFVKESDSYYDTMISGNSCYDLAGTVIGVFMTESDAQNKTNALYELEVKYDSTAKQYYTDPIELELPSTYKNGDKIYYAEISAGIGYILSDDYDYFILGGSGNGRTQTGTDEWSYEYVENDSRTHEDTTVITMSNTPGTDPLAITLTKTSTENYSLEEKPLTGAVFRVDYYDAYYETIDEAKAAGVTRTWYLQTVQTLINGEITYQASFDISGCLLDTDEYSSDALYRDEEVQICVPYGTIVVTEVEPAECYLNDPEFTDSKGNTYTQFITWASSADEHYQIPDFSNSLDIDPEVYITDTLQPDIHTHLYSPDEHEAIDDGIQPSTAVHITDTVDMEYLHDFVGKTVTVQGTLYHQSTGEPVTSHGSIVTATWTGEITGTEQSVDIDFYFDASDLDDWEDIVAYEEFIYDGTVITTHEQQDDEEQIVTVLRRHGSIQVLKTDASGNPLAGVTYALEYSVDNGNTWNRVYYYADGEIYGYEPGGCSTTDSHTDDGTITTGSDGIAFFDGLYADGRIQYRITEIHTADGYSLLEDSIYVGSLYYFEEESMGDISKYDIDGDGIFTSEDCRLLEWFVNGESDVTLGKNINGDLNGDGRTNSDDVTMIYRHYDEYNNVKAFEINVSVFDGEIQLPFTGASNSGPAVWAYAIVAIIAAGMVIGAWLVIHKKRRPTHLISLDSDR